MTTIIIAGMPAIGKTTVANILAKKLGMEAIGGSDILKELAESKGYSPEGADWWDTKEGIRFLKDREANTDFDKEADEILLKKIKKGGLVVTSYTAPWLAEDCFKVWLSASLETRARRMAKRDGMGVEQCKKTIKVRDSANNKLYKSLYNIDFGNDLKPFDMVVNTGSITPDQTANLIIKRMKELGMIW
jgi:cytidylate kinase